MNRLPQKKRIAAIAALVEGNSIRSTVHMTEVAKNTVTKLLVDVGMACAEYQGKVLRDLRFCIFNIIISDFKRIKLRASLANML